MYSIDLIEIDFYDLFVKKKYSSLIFFEMFAPRREGAAPIFSHSWRRCALPQDGCHSAIPNTRAGRNAEESLDNSPRIRRDRIQNLRATTRVLELNILFLWRGAAGNARAAAPIPHQFMEMIEQHSPSLQRFEYQAAIQDFRRARRRAELEHVVAFLKGQSDELLSYEDVRKQLKVTGASLGKLRDIPLDAIVGSVGRYKDFTRSFLPRNDSDEARWTKIKTMYASEEGLPPIEVYQIGEVYFVLDGNHRVSVAKALGATTIEAIVTKIKTKVPITAGIQPDELTLRAEYAEFLSRTHLDEFRPDADLMMSAPGKYRLIEEQIEEHRYFMGIRERREIPYNQAIVDWHDTVYAPITALIRQHDLLKDFPNRTITDIYLQISEYRAAIREGDVAYFEENLAEIQAQLPLMPDMDLEKVILDAEYVEFLEQTQIERVRPHADIRVTAPGQYAELRKHIDVHRYFMGKERAREIPFDEAIGHWHDTVYLPIVLIIRQLGMLRDFQNRTEADLYLWISERRQELEKRLGWKILPEKAAADLLQTDSANPERIISRVSDKVIDLITPDQLEAGPPPGEWRKEDLGRRNDRLFGSMLVPLSGLPHSWVALDQAIEIARVGGQHIYGLHVIAEDTGDLRINAQRVKAEFEKRCQEAGIEGALKISAGETARTICDLSRWTDLVVLNLAHPPGSSPIAKMQSGFRTILWRCSRPVLAVPGEARPLRRILLAYDGSEKADEALFVAAYIGGFWGIPVVTLTAEEPGRTSTMVMTLARQYLKQRGVEGVFVTESGSVSDAILSVSDMYRCDLIIMGSYGRSPVMEIMLGSTVDPILQRSRIPVLICR